LKVLGARITELEVLEIDLLRQPRGRHHAPGLLLKEELEAMRRSMFGISSERRPKNDGNGDQKKDTGKGKPKSGHGPRSQPDLPIEKVVHTLAEDDRTCSFCGGELKEMGAQVQESEEITVISLEYKILHHHRQKYRCGCNAQIVTAPAPVKLMPGGRYSIDFAAHVAEDKYLDHMPLERQVRAMARAGLIIDSQTLWDQIEKLAQHLQPTYEALCKQALKAGVIYADETRWQMMALRGRLHQAAAADDVLRLRGVERGVAVVGPGWPGLDLPEGECGGEGRASPARGSHEDSQCSCARICLP
jgi:transposase